MFSFHGQEAGFLHFIMVPSRLCTAKLKDFSELFMKEAQGIKWMCVCKFKGVSLSIKNNQCSILSKNGSEGAEEVVPCGYNGEEINIGCNEAYMIDALGCFNTDSIVLKFGDTAVTPILIEDDSVKCVVVPMRM